jgi:hypothetical protein
MISLCLMFALILIQKSLTVNAGSQFPASVGPAVANESIKS